MAIKKSLNLPETVEKQKIYVKQTFFRKLADPLFRSSLLGQYNCPKQKNYREDLNIRCLNTGIILIPD